MDNIERKNIHKLPFRITKNCKLQWFQYRIINRILGTNSFLFKIKIVNSKMCTFCQREEETIEHILWECEYVQAFLNEFELYVEQKTNLQLVFTKKSFILGILEINKGIQNTLILWLKYYIYSKMYMYWEIVEHSFCNMISGLQRLSPPSVYPNILTMEMIPT